MKKSENLEKSRFSMVKKWHKSTLLKALKQKKVDPQVIELANLFSQSKDYFTSSSCSGRIVLLKVNEKESKREAAFLKKWHKKVSLNEIWLALNSKTTEEIWFKQEPFILHIGCLNIVCAKKILQIAKDCGIKRAGINVAKTGKLLLEIIGTQNIAFPIKKENKLLMEKQNFGYILNRANKKLEKNYTQLKIFEKQCKKELK